MTKPILISRNAERQAEARGISLDEVVDAIRTAPWHRGRTGWSESRRNFPCRRRWAGVLCDTKQVRAVFVVEKHRVIVVTVYGYLVRTKP